MSQVPNVGDKQRLVGPPGSGGGGGGGSPATTAPPEVMQSSVLGTSLLYAREDHTHQSPTIYWPQGFGPTDNVVSNRVSWDTVTTSGTGATNFCSYVPFSSSFGLAGLFGTISGGYENVNTGDAASVGGGISNRCSAAFDGVYSGYINGTISQADPLGGFNFIGGGRSNLMVYSSYSSILGGQNNVVFGPSILSYASVLGGYSNRARMTASDARGFAADAYMMGQSSFSSGGAFLVLGAFQYSIVVVSANGTALDGDTWFNLGQFGVSGNLTLQDERSYTVLVEAVVSVPGTTDQRSWLIVGSARRDAGVVTLIAQTLVASVGTPSTSTFVIELNASGPALNVRFRTGTPATVTFNACATVRLTEVTTQVGP